MSHTTTRTTAHLFSGAVTTLLTLGLLAAPQVATAAAETSHLDPGESLVANQRLVSPNGQFVLVMQQDGNAVGYAPGNRAIWATGTSIPNSVLSMQADGNLVVVAPGNRPVWASGTDGNPGADLQLQDDSNAVVYAPGHVAKWATGSTAGPVSGPVSGAYALVVPRRSVTSGKLAAPHHNYPGIDISVPVGTPFFAVTSGRVTNFQSSKCGWGVQLNGDDGVLYKYCHASRRTRSDGSHVSAGTQLGLSGGARHAAGAGNSTGPHLHFTLQSGGSHRCPQGLLIALYNSTGVPDVHTLTSLGCTH